MNNPRPHGQLSHTAIDLPFDKSILFFPRVNTFKMLIEVVQARPHLDLVFTMCRCAFVQLHFSGLGPDLVYGQLVSVKIIACCEASSGSFAGEDVASEWLLVFETMFPTPWSVPIPVCVKMTYLNSDGVLDVTPHTWHGPLA